MSCFDATERRVDNTRAKCPDFPRRAAILARLIRHITRNVRDAANDGLRQHGLNHTDYNVLMMLYGSDDDTASPSQLAAAAREKVANMTRVCDGLAKKNFIQRRPDPHDRRRILVQMAPCGESLLETLLPDMARLLDASVAGLDTAQLATLETLLKTMLANTEQVPSPAAPDVETLEAKR